MLHLLHRALRGMLDYNALPKASSRRSRRSVRRFLKARQYLSAALAGGGAREVARRSRQIAAGSLRAENGLAV